MRKYFPIYEEAVSHIWLCNCSILNFLIYEEIFSSSFLSVYGVADGQVALPGQHHGQKYGSTVGDVVERVDHTDKKEKKIFLIYKEIQRDRVLNHILLTTFSYMVKYLYISSYIRKPFIMYDFAPDPIWITLYMRKICQCILGTRQSQTRLCR